MTGKPCLFLFLEQVIDVLREQVDDPAAGEGGRQQLINKLVEEAEEILAILDTDGPEALA